MRYFSLWRKDSSCGTWVQLCGSQVQLLCVICDLSSPTWSQTLSHTARRILNHWTSREVSTSWFFMMMTRGRLPWWLWGREFTCQCRRPGFYPWVGKIPRRRKWQPTAVLSYGKSRGQQGSCPWDCKRVRQDFANKQQQQDMRGHQRTQINITQTYNCFWPSHFCCLSKIVE